MKAIPTNYNGTIYRSRLEARWQVFFDEIGFIADYEPFEIKYNGHSYVPDFIVTHGLTEHTLIEIKPIQPNKEYVEYLTKIHNPSKRDILICIGEPDLMQPQGVRISGRGRGKTGSIISVGFTGLRCPECHRYTINPLEIVEMGYAYLDCQHFETQTNDHAKAIARDYRFDLAR